MKPYQIKAMYKDRILIFKIEARDLSEALRKGEERARLTFLEAYGSVMGWRTGESKLKVLELDEESEIRAGV